VALADVRAFGGHEYTEIREIVIEHRQVFLERWSPPLTLARASDSRAAQQRMGQRMTTSTRPAAEALPARQRIETYYDQTWKDYRFLWLNRRNLAFHFGYFDEATQTHAQALQNTNRTLADRARVGPGQRVLDAGCGVGGSGLWLAQQRGALVVGVTLVRGQVLLGRQLAARHGCAERLLFVQTDYTRTPFASGSFDVVWALESLCHAPRKAAFYDEAARVLRSGGRLVVAEYMRAARPLPAPAEHMMRQWLDGWAIPDLDTPAEHTVHATAAGLGEVSVDNFTPRARRSLRRLYRIACVSYPFARTARLLGMRSATQHGNVVAALRQYQALQRGYWQYTVLTAAKP
jgi:cyclopropane fatty-acyl-phospholipid synthase-like methyltransferase